MYVRVCECIYEWVCVCVYMSMCICVYEWVCMWLCTYEWIYVSKYVSVYLSTWMNEGLCVWVCICECENVYISVYEWMYIYVCVSMYASVYMWVWDKARKVIMRGKEEISNGRGHGVGYMWHESRRGTLQEEGNVWLMFFIAVTWYLTRSNLREDRFIWAHSSRGYSFIGWVGGYHWVSIGWLHLLIQRENRKWD